MLTRRTRSGSRRRTSLVVREQATPVLRQHRGHQQHVGRVLAGPHAEPLVDVLAEHAGGERPEALAELDLEVHRAPASAGTAASPMMLRAPRARGPNSIRPWNQPTTFSVGHRARRRARSARSRRRSAGNGAPALVQELLDLARSVSRPEKAALLESRPFGDRGRSRSWCQTNRAAPRAPPASPAAGWIQMFSNGPSRSSLPLATQLSATPPARTRFFRPGLPMRRRTPCAA